MKMHLHLATRDLDASVAFYAVLLNGAPSKQRSDYALFITDDPGLELALDAGGPVPSTGGHHFGIAVGSPDAVDAHIERLTAAGYAVDVEREETCCYAKQTKVWASDPDGRRWEFYFVHEETDDRDDVGTACCG
jgi:catechol 2,3-dioxygenase-like lactoylglutathione lyase family enzyme